MKHTREIQPFRIGTWSLELLWCLVIGNWCLRKRSALHSPLPFRAPRLEIQTRKRAGKQQLQKENSEFLVAGGDEAAGVAFEGCGQKRPKKRGARRSLLSHPHPCSLLSESHESMAEKLPSAPRTYHPATLLEGVCFGRCANYTNALPCFRGRPSTGSLDRSHLPADTEHRANISHATPAPARSKAFALPTAADGQALAQEGRGPRPCPIRLLIVRAMFGPLRLSRAKYEYVFRTA